MRKLLITMVGNKVEFNEETKEKYRTWLKSKDNCGHTQFCRELRQFDLDGYFTVSGIGNRGTIEDFEVILKELPNWYFSSSEFIFI